MGISLINTGKRILVSIPMNQHTFKLRQSSREISEIFHILIECLFENGWNVCLYCILLRSGRDTSIIVLTSVLIDLKHILPSLLAD